jgi:hypothetical protein
LKSKSSTTDTDDNLISLLSKLLQADPDTQGSNCEWIIDQYLARQFLLEDVSRVREDILMFKELFGDRRPFPKKGYSEMKVMIREKSGKGEKKSVVKTTTKTTGITFTDCKSYFKNVKKTLPDEYKNLPPEKLDELFQRIQDANPTDDFQNCIWTVEEMKKGNIREEDLSEVKKYLGKYLKLGLPLPNFYPNFPTYSNYQLMKDAVDKNVDLLFTGDLGILLIPQTRETSCYYGAQTSWCTAQRNKKNMFEHYAKKGNIYTWFDKKLKDKFQFHFEELQFMDRDDNPISKERFKEFRNHRVLKIIFENGMKIIEENPENVYKFAIEFIGKSPEGEWPQGEKSILKTQEPLLIYKYARDIMGGRWKEAEPIILEDPETALEYARDIIGGRWKEAEPFIMRDPKIAYKYARDIIGGRWKEAEPFIMRDPKIAYKYAREIIGGRWKEAEPIILEDPRSAVEYAKYVIQGRWKEAEPIILEDPSSAVEYAKYVIQGRWKEAEPIILNKKLYKIDHITSEEKHPIYYNIYNYTTQVLKKRWKKAEPILYLMKHAKDTWDDPLYAYLNWFKLTKEQLNKSNPSSPSRSKSPSRSPK